MIFKSEIAVWIYENRNRFEIGETRFGLGPWLPGFKCIVLRLRARGYESFGFGVSKKAETGLQIAFSECIERVAALTGPQAKRLVRSTNGYAAHPDRRQAHRNAYRERIERDAFLWSWHFGHGTTTTRVKPECQSLRGERWIFRTLPSADSKLKVGLAALVLRSGGVILSTGCAGSTQAALSRAVREVAMVRAHHELKPISPMTIKKFVKTTKNLPSDHLALSMDPAYARHTVKWLETKGAPRPAKPVRFAIRDLPAPLGTDATGLHVAAVYRTNLLDFYFGPSPFGDLPHPMG